MPKNKYVYNPHRHVKIWISKNRDLFMNTENQMRTIDMRYKNPNDEITFIYDSSMLNSKAIDDLMRFCAEYELTPVDAHEFGSILTNEREIKLYEYYRDEITHLKEGGNLAVASDIIRWIAPVYSKGTYTDFDVPVNTSQLDSLQLVDAPLLLNIGSLEINTKEVVLSNNDFIAIADPVAGKEEIERIQDGMLEVLGHYTTDFVESTKEEFGRDSYFNRFLLGFMENRSESIYIAKSKSAFGDTARSSRELRSHIHQIMTDQSKFLNFNRQTPDETNESVIKRLRSDLRRQLGWVKWIFFRKEYNEISKMLAQSDDVFVPYLMKKELSHYLTSVVVCTTGPIGIAKSLFGGYVFGTDYFSKKLQPYSFSNYDLQLAFESKNSIPMHENLLGMMSFLGAEEGELNDSSWLDSGAQLQKNREVQLEIRKVTLKQNLRANILDIKDDMERHIKKLEDEANGFWGFYRSSARQMKIDALKQILDCFKQPPSHELDLVHYRKVLQDVHLNKKYIYAGLFHSRTQELIEKLEETCHEAVVLGLTPYKSVSLASPEDITPQQNNTASTDVEPIHGTSKRFFDPKKPGMVNPLSALDPVIKDLGKTSSASAAA